MLYNQISKNLLYFLRAKAFIIISHILYDGKQNIKLNILELGMYL